MFALETINNYTNDLYKKKYLKYKQKYIELKQHGGIKSVQELADTIKRLEEIKETFINDTKLEPQMREKLINDTNVAIEETGNLYKVKFAGYLATKHKKQPSIEHKKQPPKLNILDLLIQNKIVKLGPNIDTKNNFKIMDPKQLEDNININSFNELLDALDTYLIEPVVIKDTNYTNLGQVFKDILIFQDNSSDNQNLRYKHYEENVVKILQQKYPHVVIKYSFNPKKK